MNAQSISQPDRPTELEYATPAPSHGAKVLAAAAVMLGGLGLIVVGGCFLVGVMISTSGINSSAAHSPSMGFVIVLYVLAGICFCFAAIVLLAGFRALFRVIRG